MKSAPEGIRTPNLLIRSQMLYPLSYARLFSFVQPAYLTFFSLSPKMDGIARKKHKGRRNEPTPFVVTSFS